MAFLRFLFYAAFSCLIIFAGNVGAEEKYSEHQVKAAFIYNFLNFVEWPQAMENESSISVCVLGQGPIDKYLTAIDGDHIRGKTIKINRIKNSHEAEKCYTVFLNVSEQNKTKELISHIKNYPVLSISDADDFTESGGIIKFIEEGSRIKFKINLKAAQKAGLKISSRLLRIAYIVGEK
jgi:hypothetical protein